MAESLVVRLNDTAPERASWIVVDSAGAIAGSGGAGELSEAAASSDQRRVVAIVPAADVLLTRTSLPVKNAAKMLQAVPFALEEQLAEDVERLHFAVGKRADDGRVPVAVARREQVEQWLNELTAAGLNPVAMLPDTALLPTNGSAGPTLVVDGANTYLRQPDESVAVIDSACFAAVAEAVGLGSGACEEDAGSEEQAQDRAAANEACLFISQADRESYPELVQTMERRFPGCEIRGLQSGAFPRLAVSATATPQINLLQGAFAPSRSHAKLLLPWRGVGILLAIFAALLIGGKAMQLVKLSAQDAALDEQIVAAYRQAYPDGRIVDPVAQMRNALAASSIGGAGGDTEFLEMMSATASAIKQTPNVELQNVRYGRNRLEIKLSAPDVATLDRVRTALEGAGIFSAKIEGAPPRGDVVDGRISVVKK